MAIFRQGKRVGPFDIRTGISRGDLEKSAYHRTNSDPRLRQPGTYKETTIGRFRAMMGKAEGYARSARFAVRVVLPTSLSSLSKEVMGPAGQRLPNSEATTQAMNLNQLASQMGSQVNIHCDSVSMPAHDLQSEEHTMYGPPSQIVTGHGFTGTIGASFYADKYLRERHFFEMWQKMAVTMRTHRVGYLDDYAGKLQIFQLGSNDQDGDTTDVPTYGIEATECYPETVSAVEYSYGATSQLVKINVGFQYKQWFNMTTDAIGGVDFGASSQTVHEVKAGQQGFLSFLPPDLQRTGRDLVNSAKNRIPVGRIFKGKVFPPFFT